jgi:hypothetical protein
MNLYLCLCSQTAFLRISLSCCVETRIPRLTELLQESGIYQSKGSTLRSVSCSIFWNGCSTSLLYAVPFSGTLVPPFYYMLFQPSVVRVLQPKGSAL